MRPVLLALAVGLAERHLTDPRFAQATPNLRSLRADGCGAPLGAVLPAVTCSAQATLITGKLPSEHGVVGNGWYVREMGEPLLWRQPNEVVQAEKFYETALYRDPSFTCAKIFWWWNMGARVEWSVTPRPFYPADGSKILAIYGQPPSYPEELENSLGKFPFFNFWGPKSGLESSRWLADAAIHTLEQQKPRLTMVYLPHLDYDHQRFGPDDERSITALSELDGLIGDLRQAADRAGAALCVVSEYALEAADRSIDINRELRRAGLLEVRPTPKGEVLDVFASEAFAVADHQIAHVYTKSPEATAAASQLLGNLTGVDQVLDRTGQREYGLDHERAGDLVAVADRGAWFTYYYWLDDAALPDFAPTVDIHRKPGYDPAELFVDPELTAPTLRVMRKLAQKKLGFRYLMDVVPTNADQVRGTHGRLPATPEEGPTFLCSTPWSECGGEPGDTVIPATDFARRALELVSSR